MYAGPEVCSSIHARHRKSVHEVRACIAARIRDADKEGDGRSPRAGNLESVVVARQSRILAPRKPVDARKVVHLSGQNPIIATSLVARSRGIDNLEHGLHRIGLGRLQEIVVWCCVDLHDRAGRCARRIYVYVWSRGAGITISPSQVVLPVAIVGSELVRMASLPNT